MKTIIGSKRALELARKEFGERAYVLRRGKMFEVGKVLGGLGCIKTGKMWGEGRSWESALRDAGIRIPEPYEAEVSEAMHRAAQPEEG